MWCDDDDDDDFPSKDTRGWAMRRGHCRRLRADAGRESFRGRASFARTVNVGDGRGYIPVCARDLARNGRMRAAEIAEAVSERTPAACAELPLAVPAAAALQCGRKAGPSRWAEAEGRALEAAVAWRPAPKAKACRSRARPAVKQPLLPASFDELHERFLRQHREAIVGALCKVFTGEVELRPAPLSAEVKNRFLQRCKGTHTIQPVFHGTKAANHESIFRSGLMIPNAASGVNVCNGSAHGLGVYTAKLNNPYLSRGFCSEPRLLVCAVLDDAVQLAVPRPLGRFFVTAESVSVRHVGDAIVVMDPCCVVPLFEASGEGFATASTFVPVAAIPAQIRVSPAPCVTASRPPVYAAAAQYDEAVAAARRAEVRRLRMRRRKPRKPQVAVPAFLARRAVQRRLL